MVLLARGGACAGLCVRVLPQTVMSQPWPRDRAPVKCMHGAWLCSGQSARHAAGAQLEKPQAEEGAEPDGLCAAAASTSQVNTARRCRVSRSHKQAGRKCRVVHKKV